MTNFTANFDDSVKRALEKWPNVPNCFGWLKLDRRGNWLIQNELIRHGRAIEFIARNYAEDAHGRWYVQNGPQRVFCELEYTPLVFRLTNDRSLVTHTGRQCQKLEQILLDELGNVLLHTDLGLGLMDDRDLLAFTNQVETSLGDEWLDFEHLEKLTAAGKAPPVRLGAENARLGTVLSTLLPTAFGFQQRPEDNCTETKPA